MDQPGSIRQAMRTRRTDSALFARIAPPAAFLSQMIATRQPQTVLARAPEATTAYARSARIAVRRLPPGYRRTVSA
jgi:hypothetical protein